MQKTGHRPIALMGGGTSKIGDPSGKDTSRSLLTNEQIDAAMEQSDKQVLDTTTSLFFVPVRGARKKGGKSRKEPAREYYPVVGIRRTRCLVS